MKNIRNGIFETSSSSEDSFTIDPTEITIAYGSTPITSQTVYCDGESCTFDLKDWSDILLGAIPSKDLETELKRREKLREELSKIPLEILKEEIERRENAKQTNKNF